MKRPTVKLRCPADKYSAANQRIVEFSDSLGNGGLISFREQHGKLYVELYRCDKNVKVSEAPRS